jgi:3-oxoisoapionate kinase
MSKHPVTPADESDLRLHLGKQTNKKFGLIDVLQLDKPVEEWNDAIQPGEEVILLDALYESQLLKIGEWINGLNKNGTQFTVGGSGIEAALGNYWNEKGLLKQRTAWQKIEKTNPLLVVSGSCSPVTAAQIAYAKVNGFEEVELDAVKICNGEIVEAAVTDKINELLQQQKNLIVHTGQKTVSNLSSEKLGTVLGTIARQAVEKNNLQRVVIAGGDTSSYAARAMEIDAVEMIAPLVSGAPLCKAISKNESINGIEVNFKGGQVGSENYFGMLLNGE